MSSGFCCACQGLGVLASVLLAAPLWQVSCGGAAAGIGQGRAAWCKEQGSQMGSKVLPGRATASCSS